MLNGRLGRLWNLRKTSFEALVAAEKGQDQDRRQAEAGRKSDLRLLCGNRIGSRMKRKHWTFKIISRQFETFSWQDLVGMFNYSVIFSNTSRLGYFSSIFMFSVFSVKWPVTGASVVSGSGVMLETAGYSVFTFPPPGPMFEFLHNTDKFLCPTALLSKVWIVRSSECHVSRATCHTSPSIPDNCGDVGDMRKCLIHVHNQSENQQTMSKNNHPKIMKTECKILNFKLLLG